MRREHIKDGWWEMRGEPVSALGWPPGTKNAQAHRVWLPVPVQALLAVMGDAGAGFVFAGPRGRAARSLDEAMRRYRAKLGVERATSHDLRRTFYDQHRPEARLYPVHYPKQCHGDEREVTVRVGNDTETRSAPCTTLTCWR